MAFIFLARPWWADNALGGKCKIVEAEAAIGVKKVSWATLIFSRVRGLMVGRRIGHEGLEIMLPADFLPGGK